MKVIPETGSYARADSDFSLYPAQDKKMVFWMFEYLHASNVNGI